MDPESRKRIASLEAQLAESERLHREVSKKHFASLQQVYDLSPKDTDPIDWTVFRLNFQDLAFYLKQLVLRFFNIRPNGKTGWTEYDQMKDPDDRRWFLQAYFADSIAETYFTPKTYGVEMEIENAFCKFETSLERLGGGKYTLLAIVTQADLTC